jgi:hypothetical protein
MSASVSRFRSTATRLFGLVAFLILAKLSCFFLKFACILAELLRIVKDLLLSGRKNRADLPPRIVPHGLNLYSLLLSDRFDLRPAGRHDLFDFFFLFFREIQQTIQHLLLNNMITMTCPMATRAVKPILCTAKLIPSTEFLRICGRRRILGGRRGLRRGDWIRVSNCKLRNNKSCDAYDTSQWK